MHMNGKVATEWVWRVISLGTTILLALGLFMMKQLNDSITSLDTTVRANQIALAEIQGNRFTSGDANRIWERIAEMAAADAARQQQTDDLERRVQQCEERLR